MSESIPIWQYVDRLTSLYYEEYGVALDREFFGTLTATLIPPSLAIVTNILEAILAVSQGVKCISLGYAEQGHRIQDIAAIRTLGQLASDIIHKNLGYKDVQINTVFHQYMAAFPPLPEQAETLIYESAVTASLACPTRLIIKTPVEAYKIPTLVDNIHGLALAMHGISTTADDILINEKLIDLECNIIRHEVESILDAVVFCGKGNIAQGIVNGFRDGIIDIPFAPSIHNRGEVVTARDVEGAVRYIAFGNLPFSRELREFHREKMWERRREEGIKSEKQNYILVERDVLMIFRGQYKQWPLFPNKQNIKSTVLSSDLNYENDSLSLGKKHQQRTLFPLST